ncbi:MAG: protein-export chaperone SecB [Spirochaetales bacterium]|nr:protein-export chaperone SecB [Spirochaetales bacterium]
MNKAKQPGINFNNIILKDLNFSRNTDCILKPQLKVDLDAKNNISEDKNNLNVELTIEISEEENNSFHISCTMVGEFSVSEGTENMDLESFSKVNAVSLMIPYLREVISSVTTRSGLKPVILPPINVSALAKNNSNVKL